MKKQIKIKRQSRCKICGIIMFNDTGDGICEVCQDEMIKIQEELEDAFIDSDMDNSSDI